MKVNDETSIALIEEVVAAARRQLLKLPAEVAPNDDEVRIRLKAELTAILARTDEAVLAHLRRLRGVQGHA